MEFSPEAQSISSQAASSSPDLFGVIAVIFMVIVLALILGATLIIFLPYIVGWYKFREREKQSLQYVLLQVSVPRANEVKIEAAEQLFSAFYSIKD